MKIGCKILLLVSRIWPILIRIKVDFFLDYNIISEPIHSVIYEINSIYPTFSEKAVGPLNEKWKFMKVKCGKMFEGYWLKLSYVILWSVIYIKDSYIDGPYLYVTTYNCLYLNICSYSMGLTCHL